MKDLAQITVNKVMTRSLKIVDIDTSFEEVVKTFNETKVHALIVVGPGGEFMGILSHSDIIKGLQEYGPKIFVLTAEDLMHPKPFTIDPNANLKEAAAIMVKNRIHRLLVISSHAGKYIPIGVLSATDIIKAVANT
ncbi:putative signal transduction protein with CBS domains [Thermodesulfatator indicus DSM 15286]|uniref:Signal transduction protein with CBS domains n=1 Tax=Thermodesulfatator indicus (strain DSM 15286 / JCM 11887 / CIR29812) TaxID=667014 RepID=F8ACH3_THEID|nr:CBS domain-containing protein [Thermodesulfatator indicus]AEH44674.1 putative signal transduction protein with CBS domains [Thermodesulfatator indicus DSM 15286]